MSKLVALCSAVVIASFALGGCTVRAQVKAGGEAEPVAKPTKAEPKPKKPKRKKKVLAKLKKIKNEIELPEPVPYKTGSAELDEEAGADEILTLVKEYMEQNPEVTLVRVEGHTDSDGDDASNMNLSKARSASATKWLVDHNIACKRLMPVGFGETKPLVANDSAENKAKNRRVSFFDATIKGKPVLDENTKQPVPVDGGGQIAVDPCNPAITK